MPQHMKPITRIDVAQQAIKAHSHKSERLVLPISDDLLDPMGINMAMITDSILAQGLEPNGFIQKDGYRLYFYIEMK